MDPARAVTSPLSRLIVVCCFACPHHVAATTPQEAHDLMEAHYAEAHGPLIRRLAGELG